MTQLLPPPSADRLTIEENEFRILRKLVYENFGIDLGEHKRSLVVGRLQKVLRQRGLPDFAAYVEWLLADRTGAGLEELANRISTNHTYFWRENSHFDYFVTTVLPELAERHRDHGTRVRIWCAGCSSGEEPYTLVMLMKEVFGADYAALRPMLLATDISATALSTAMNGVYAGERLQRMPEVLRRKYFRRTGRPGLWQVVDEVRSEIVFRRHNLMSPSYPFRKPFDGIFCRNVMIYFDKPTREALIERFHKHTVAGGFLFIGHSETLGRDTRYYDYIMPAAYRRR
ncbi:MAG TPA: protein-glutamate O-methyltransferase [Candidatus Krumholzibacteria bacterium]|nr:protein-glutamate O-methyltransferase [Candidatus Krumholzibacteria bacterium]HPD73343.1 protein-glutamate O-methyltransferase [Candidatus Krumholzibacteria bacterium]HRY42136.1 protein-glutamate O-methyltransferase [Candidatus Krumholzibacteria bacterium]